ncbi:uncharacterized protein LOC133839801 [Drosophila sulfurigaster albostrigata]|uniref:uncharacterized protein LOC133839801 n=1 Tax=Drosophila sulfurigaster albostrigata TaxID=89887 RepID=UPI002D21ED46|nr:uncharacterized protein LOC133839801 [Drosophila sulfurigaster albostrigata]
MQIATKMNKLYLHGFIIGVVLIIACCNVPVAKASSFVMQSGECKYNPKFFDNFTIAITNNTLNLDMITKRRLTRGFKVQFDFALSLGKSKNYQSVFTHTMDTCEAVAAVKSNIFKAWFQSMQEHGNFMYNCPVEEGRYFVHNWQIESQLVPQFLHRGNYRVTGHFFFGNLKPRVSNLFWT